MTITITAFERSPDGGRGLARDTRVRWALEEVGQPYQVRLVSFAAMKEPAHLRLHPFGQIPTYEEGDLVLFETGAIVFHIAARHAGLLPDDADARARAITWMFAALNSVEPPILELATAMLLESDKPWSRERLPLVEDRVRKPLRQLSARLGAAEWLDGAFSAGDLMMVSVLLRLRSSGILDEFPNLAAYVARGEARPAYQRAFAAQLAVNAGSPPAARGQATTRTRSCGMTRTIEGGCLCGAVRYRIEGEPIASTTCQCRSCRKASAAAIVPWLHLDAAKLAFIAGQPVEYKSSPAVTRSFCGRCGTPLTYWIEHYGSTIDVTTASLDDPDLFPPMIHVWTSHKLGWVTLADGLPYLEEGAPSE